MVLVVDVGVAVFLIVLAALFLLGGVALMVTVVDALTQVLLVELEAEVALVDLSVVAVVSRLRLPRSMAASLRLMSARTSLRRNR